MAAHPHTDALLASDPFGASPALFVGSFRENALHHYEHHPYVRALWDEAGWHPRQLTDEAALAASPAIMVNAFKENVFKTAADADVVLHLTSSGTGGAKSHQFLDAESLANVKKSAWNLHRAMGLVDESRSTNYLCFTYDPKVANDLGTAFTDELLTSYTPKREVYYAFQWDEAKKDFVFDRPATAAKLREFAASGYPTRVLGFPAFLNQLVEEFDLRLSLGANSWVQTGGGWKGLADKEIPKAEFRRKIAERLGVPLTHVRDMFGMVEHGIPYLDCEEGQMHLPNYSRVYVRDPRTLETLPDGETGLVQFLCSYNFSYPAFNFIGTDYGRIITCTCPRGGRVLQFAGRAGVSKHKGCAIKALELMESQS
jgi:phenylacetate-coenzyme A ligase PaaK-like adenylate-forming protein